MAVGREKPLFWFRAVNGNPQHARSFVAMATRQYQFHVLRSNVIVERLEEIGVSVTPQMLMEPTTEGMITVYRALVDEFFDELVVDSPASMEQTLAGRDHPEMFTDSTEALAFVKHLVLIMRSAGVEDFSPRELENPDRFLFRRALSAIINFGLFRAGRLDKFEELLQSSSDLYDEKEQRELEVQAVREQIRALQARLEQEAPELEAHQEERKELDAQLLEATTKETGLKEAYSVVKGKREELKQENAAKLSETKTAELENERLEKQVVRSPEKVRKFIEDMKETLVAEREEIAKSEQRMEEGQARIEDLSRVQKEIRKATEVQSQVREEMQRASDEKKAVNKVKSKLSATTMNLQDQDQQMQQAQRQAASLAEKTNRMRQKAQQKEEEDAATLADVENDRVEADSQREVAKTKANENKRAGQQIQADIQQLQAKHEQNVENLLDQYQKLDHTVRQYQQRILHEIQQ
jgi:Nuf2 family/Nuf2, DHR10-like domain